LSPAPKAGVFRRVLAAVNRLHQVFAAPGAGGKKVPTPSYLRIRRALFVLSVIVGLCGIWMLVPALLAPVPHGLGLYRDLADAAFTRRSPAVLAARIAAIRGDLWAEAAFTGARFMWEDPGQRPSAARSSQLNGVKANAETALKLAPINAAAWLLLSMLTQNAPDDDSRVSIFLEMSYFTAPNDLSLGPLRLMRAAMSSALANKDIQYFIKNDIRGMLDRGPEHQQDILAAYRAAWPRNQPVLAAMVAEIDPAVAGLLSPPRLE
jgi:hypothetical protein